APVPSQQQRDRGIRSDAIHSRSGRRSSHAAEGSPHPRWVSTARLTTKKDRSEDPIRRDRLAAGRRYNPTRNVRTAHRQNYCAATSSRTGCVKGVTEDILLS